jgi:exopolysaccharide production protein ExoQ
MPPDLALLIWFVLLSALLIFDPAKESGTSPALWIPVTWLFIIASRLPSQWMGGQVGQVAQALEDGNPLDRTIFSLLILLAIGVLLSRSFNWGKFFGNNLALTAFLLFALISIVWSDFPFIAFKRWFRDLGNYLVILVILSDPRPLVAVRAVLRRVAYLLVPLSVVLDKYFPGMSRQFDQWTGMGMFVGATTSKNLLGLLAMLSALFFFWDIITRWANRKEKQTKRIILVSLAFFAMSLSLVINANSTTCKVDVVIGCAVLAAAHTGFFRRHPKFFKILIPSSFVLYLVLALGFDMSGSMAAAVGKDPTLTDRTKIWAFLLGMHTNPLIGTGYESFWLGDRLQAVWRAAGVGHINESHNGYLELYLNLGLVGLGLMVAVLISSYRTICKRITPFTEFGSLSLALWTIMLFFSITEAGFRSGLMWLVFLMAALTVPVSARQWAYSEAVPRSSRPEPREKLATVTGTGDRDVAGSRFLRLNSGLARR